MNSFGTLFRIHLFGESHGDGVGVIIDGCPAGIPLAAEDFTDDLARRKGGTKGTTPRVEEDAPKFLTGIFNGHTTGAPITIFFYNQNVRSDVYESMRSVPRPGHADFVAHHKYKGFQDYRGGGHFSGRLTVCLVAAGVVAKKLTQQFSYNARVIEVHGHRDIEAGLQVAIQAKDSVGGVVQCKVQGVPIGLGEPFFNSVESMIAHLAFAVPAIKGIEFGSGFKATHMLGSENNDAIVAEDGATETNHSGGINGGLSNGNDIIFNVAVKPASSTPAIQTSLNMATGEQETFSIKGRHDLCIALRVPVIMEAVAAIVLADLHMQAEKVL